VGKVNKQNKTQQNEYRGTNEGDIISPENEKAVRNEKGDNNEKYPEENFGTPPTACEVSNDTCE
jgi:hypothetical protein